jgi:hypothetical protein
MSRLRSQVSLVVGVVLGLCLLSRPQLLPAQALIATGDPRAVQLAVQSFSALTGGIAVHDAILQGTVERPKGSNSSKTSVRLIALTGHQSRVEYGPGGTDWRETRTEVNGQPRFAYSDNRGVAHPADSRRDTWSEAVWFFPALSLLGSANDPGVRFAYIGASTLNGTPVTHIRASRAIAADQQNVTDRIAQLSATDFYIDNKTALPVALSFRTRPDRRAPSETLHWIVFSDYTQQQGISYPATIKELINGTLVNQITITSASFNTGLASVTAAGN